MAKVFPQLIKKIVCFFFFCYLEVSINYEFLELFFYTHTHTHTHTHTKYTIFFLIEFIITPPLHPFYFMH
jgi:hypothetical protein